MTDKITVCPDCQKITSGNCGRHPVWTEITAVMSDKPEVPSQRDVFWEVVRERDELRAEVELLKGVRTDLNLVIDKQNAEVERLMAINTGLVRDYNHMLLQEKSRSDERDEARAEVELLKVERPDWWAVIAENERLRVALEQIMLNTPLNSPERITASRALGHPKE